MTTKFKGLTIRDLQDFHANAPTLIIAYDERGETAFVNGPCFGFYKAVHLALPDVLDRMERMEALLDRLINRDPMIEDMVLDALKAPRDA